MWASATRVCRSRGGKGMIYTNVRQPLQPPLRTGGRLAGVFSRIERVEDRVQEMRERAAMARAGTARVGYIGWAGHGNLGDDAMLAAIGGLLGDASVLEYAHPRKERRLARVGLSGSRFFQSVVLGGGTLISDGFAAMPELALEQNVPLWSFGTGVGSCGFGMPPEVSFGRWRDILPRFRAIGVRGPLSHARLCGLGVENVEVIGDPALSLTLDEAAPAADPPMFALNVTLPDGARFRAADHPFLFELETVARRLVRGGWTAVPVAMCDDDLPALAWFLRRVYGDDVPISTPRTADAFLDTVSPCAFTIAVRLHAAVLSCCAGVPPLMLGYRDKCLDFMQSLDLAEYHVALDDMADGELAYRAERLRQDAPCLRSIVLERAQAWKRAQADYLRKARAGR